MEDCSGGLIAIELDAYLKMELWVMKLELRFLRTIGMLIKNGKS